jgi:drug/metabolite transporter (DMT)-like permease
METMALTTPTKSTRLTKGYLIAIIGTVFWSWAAIFIRYLTQNYHLPPLVLAFWRDLFVMLALGGVFIIINPSRLRLERGQLKFLALYGLVLSIFNSLWTISVALNGAAVSTVLAYSSVAFTALFAWRIFGERLDRVKLLAVTFSIIGCAFVSGAYDPSAWKLNPLGIITGLLSGVAFAGYSLLGKESSNRNIPPWTAMLYTFGFAALYLLVCNLLPVWGTVNRGPADLMVLGTSWTGWAVLVMLAVGPTIAGYGLYTVSLTHLPASVANLIATLEPAMTAVLAYLFLAERLTLPQLAGSALIIVGVLILRLSEGMGGKIESGDLTTNFR